jgi:hypothetical protein
MSKFTDCSAVQISGAVNGIFATPAEAAAALLAAGIDCVLHYETHELDGFFQSDYRCPRDGQPEARFKLRAWSIANDCPVVTAQDCCGNIDNSTDEDGCARGEETTNLTAVDLEAIDSYIYASA